MNTEDFTETHNEDDEDELIDDDEGINDSDRDKDGSDSGSDVSHNLLQEYQEYADMPASN